jgi:hypothetical protein
MLSGVKKFHPVTNQNLTAIIVVDLSTMSKLSAPFSDMLACHCVINVRLY